jgi:flagellar biosynthesis/type III secretory pathway M-ring protein FliF/YscJ
MALFLVSQYAGRPKMVELLPGATAEAQSSAVSFLEGAGIETKTDGGRLMVPAEKYLAAVSALGEAGKLPEDASITFRNYIEKQHWMNPKSENDRIYNTALENTLAQCLRKFKGIESATVVIDAPEPAGIGSIVRKPTASVVVVTTGMKGLEQATVEAIAAMVASAKAGLDPRQVSITDGRRKYSVRAEDDFAASTYLEHMAKCEEYVRGKIVEHLAYIPGVSVAVNAQVDVRRATSKMRSIKPKGAGSETLTAKESSTTSNQTQAAGGGGEPGLGSNVAMDLNSSGGGQGGTKVAEEMGEVENDTAFGADELQIVDPRGMATKINAAIGIPRNYIAALIEQTRPEGAPATAPTETEIKQAFEEEKSRIEKDVAPLIETDAAGALRTGETVTAGTVVVSLIPVPVAAHGPGAGGAGGEGGSSAGTLGGIGTLASSALMRVILLGGLAVLALAMMLMLVRKASKPAELPTAEELVGIPPALTANTDLVGEADEGDTAMTGIEIDDDSLRTKKMLEEVSELVKGKPAEAAALFNRWIATDS